VVGGCERKVSFHAQALEIDQALVPKLWCPSLGNCLNRAEVAGIDSAPRVPSLLCIAIAFVTAKHINASGGSNRFGPQPNEDGIVAPGDPPW
jgi:hypothetical protein